MEALLWFIGLMIMFGLGFVCAWTYKTACYEADFKEIQRDVFSIVYDVGVHPDKKVPLVFRLKNLDKYFNLDEVRDERDEPETFINPADYIAGDDISCRINNRRAVNADGTNGVRRGVKEDEWVV